MGMASFLMQTDINMLGSLKTKKEKDWDYILYRVDQNILVNGKMVKKLGME